MNITFFSGSPDKRKPTKDLTALGSPVLCAPYNDFSIEHPSFIISNTPPVTASMFYIDDLQRYYIITDITYTSGGRTIISGDVDVLYTYWDTIKNSEVTVTRNENTRNNDIIDTSISLKSEKQIVLKAFGEPLQTNETTYILGVI